MKVFFINIDARADKRAFIEGQIQELGLEGIRVDAVIPATVSPELLARSTDPRRRRRLTPTELCCSLSHIRAAEMVATGRDEFGLVVEDDAVLSRRLPALLEAVERGDRSFDLLRIETGAEPMRAISAKASIAGCEVLAPCGWTPGSAAYVLSKRGARIIAGDASLLEWPADKALFNPYRSLARRLRLRQLSPALAIQSDHMRPVEDRFSSDVVGGRSSSNTHSLTRLFFTALDRIELDVVIGAQRLWRQYAWGAKKQLIEFAPE